MRCSHAYPSESVDAVQRARDTVHLITLHRPEKRNALHPDLIARLAAALKEVDADDGIRVVVLTGAGDSFCSGLDLKHLVGLGTEARVEYMRSAFSLFRKLYELRQPVIAAVNGPAIRSRDGAGPAGRVASVRAAVAGRRGTGRSLSGRAGSEQVDPRDESSGGSAGVSGAGVGWVLGHIL